MLTRYKSLMVSFNYYYQSSTASGNFSISAIFFNLVVNKSFSLIFTKITNHNFISHENISLFFLFSWTLIELIECFNKICEWRKKIWKSWIKIPSRREHDESTPETRPLYSLPKIKLLYHQQKLCVRKKRTRVKIKHEFLFFFRGECWAVREWESV